MLDANNLVASVMAAQQQARQDQLNKHVREYEELERRLTLLSKAKEYLSNEEFESTKESLVTQLKEYLSSPLDPIPPAQTTASK